MPIDEDPTMGAKIMPNGWGYADHQSSPLSELSYFNGLRVSPQEASISDLAETQRRDTLLHSEMRDLLSNDEALVPCSEHSESHPLEDKPLDVPYESQDFVRLSSYSPSITTKSGRESRSSIGDEIVMDWMLEDQYTSMNPPPSQSFNRVAAPSDWRSVDNWVSNLAFVGDEAEFSGEASPATNRSIKPRTPPYTSVSRGDPDIIVAPRLKRKRDASGDEPDDADLRKQKKRVD